MLGKVCMYIKYITFFELNDELLQLLIPEKLLKCLFCPILKRRIIIQFAGFGI